MNILGIGGILNDPAVALLSEGEFRVAVEQRKIARRHRSAELPVEAIEVCLRTAKVERAAIDCAAVARPLGSGLETGAHLALRSLFPGAQVVLVDHHMAHAASAFYASPFEKATVLTLDREGDLRCGARWTAANGLNLDREMYFPDSLGDLYSRVTALLGFQPNADEHKVQWLSASADDKYAGLFLEMLAAPAGHWPRLNRAFFESDRHAHGGFSAHFFRRLGLTDETKIPEEMRGGIAAGLQKAIERTVLEMAGTGENLALAGGLALNALLIHSLETSGNWKNVFVQPAAGNAGTAFGAAYHAWHTVMGQGQRISIQNLCLGPSYSAEEIKQVLENCKLQFRYLRTTSELIERAVTELNGQKIIAWMHGRMEFGPRALGNRSILASPLNPYSTENLNLFIKHRETFRKFAASVPAEAADEYFVSGSNARFLATVGRIKPTHRKTFEPALLGSEYIRVHSVSREDNPLYWELLHAVGKSTGLPVLYNTSFNLFGDPMVCTPRDAVRSFFSSGIDSMFVGNFLLGK